MEKNLYIRSAVFICLLWAMAMIVSFIHQADAAQPATRITHKPVKRFIPGHRIVLKAKVKDPGGVEILRCYFKTRSEADYVFIKMEPGTPDLFQGTLPSPSETTGEIDYLFLCVNKQNEIVKTQVFTAVRDKKHLDIKAETIPEAPITIYSETEQRNTPPGFSDNILMDQAESSSRFGLTAGGLYSGLSGSGAEASALTATGPAATATQGGTIIATAGISTATMVTIGTVTAAGLAAVAAGGGGGDDDDNHDQIIISGPWSGSFTETTPQGVIFSGQWQMEVSVDNGFKLTQTWQQEIRTFTGSWTVTGNTANATLIDSATGKTATMEAQISGNRFSGTMVMDSGGSSIFEGSRSGGILVEW